MQIPLSVSFEHMEPDPEIRKLIEDETKHLESFHGHITGCHVAVRAPKSRHRSGDLYDVHIRLTLPPHQDIVVNRTPADEHVREHLPAAVRDAFARARRMLQDSVRRMDGDVKEHRPPATGRVARFLAGEDCGFIETADGQEVYFHRNSVLDGAFDRLRVGDEVRFVTEAGERGEQATTVRPIGKHHPM